MFTTHEADVLIGVDAMNLAHSAGRAVERLLVTSACHDVKNRDAGVVNCADIEAAARNATLVLAALVSSLRTDTHASQERIA